MLSVKTFLQATRPRTYPLAMAGIFAGNATAYTLLKQHAILWSAHHWQVFLLSLWVALALQILSNLANDYGDGIKGTDAHRQDRQTAQGTIKASVFKKLIVGWALFTFMCGVRLLWLSFDNLKEFLLFLTFGIIAIFAACAYTMGKNPYGYRTKGEVAVFVFFGLLSICGSQYLQVPQLSWLALVVAIAIGLLCTCVLMVNNMRDIEEDRTAGKVTLAVLLGKQKTSHLYYALLCIGITLLTLTGIYQQKIGLIILPMLIAIPVYQHLKTIKNYANQQIPPSELATQLKKIVLITLVSSVIYSLNQLQQ